MNLDHGSGMAESVWSGAAVLPGRRWTWPS